jgi:hypothetical protein
MTGRLDAERGEHLYYLEVETPDGIKRVQLTRDRLSIGRLSYNDIRLASSQISRQHAEMRLIDGDWWIADLHSTNGLHLNAQRIQEHRLLPGDCIVMAPGISIRFLSDAPPPLPSVMPDIPPWRAEDGHQQARGESPAFPSPLITMPPPGGEVHRRPRPGVNGSAGHPTLPGASAPTTPPSLEGGDDALPDPFRRTIPASERHGLGPGPGQSLLHVCQTCGQLTAPDTVFCQSCHHTIALECPQCHLSLLPIQDRCPRCQTPNPGSVRRTRRAPEL